MASRVIMPKLTDSMEEGVVVKWRKTEGEHVESGDVLAEIETDKAVMDLEAFASGTLRKILVPEGTTVPSGALIGVIAEPEEDIQGVLKQTPAPSRKAAINHTRPSHPPSLDPPGRVLYPPAQARSVDARSRPSGVEIDAPLPGKIEAVTSEPALPEAEVEASASPRVRTLAREHGIDLKNVKGSGPAGRIVERDLEGLLPKKRTDGAAAGKAVQEVPLSQMRKAVARITTQSKAPVPHFYVTSEVDMSEALRVVERSKASGTPISINHLIIAASARALEQHPGINASYGGDTIRLFSSIDIGMAVSLDDGLMVPVLRDCAAKTLTQIAEAERALVARTRSRELKPEEYSGATFLISNLGMYDIDNFIAIILPPAAAALAIASVHEVPVVHEGRVEIGRRMKMTLASDHRVIDGVGAAKFLQTVKAKLEDPRNL